jgi:peptide/nickel transport system permease protein
MLRYVLQRIVSLIPTVLLLLTAIFFVIDILPGDAAMMALGLELGMEQIETMRKIMGLDKPPVERFFAWLSNLLRGDLGVSIRTRDSVAGLIANSLPVTITLATVALALALIIAIPTGILSATRRNSLTDFLASVGSLLGLSIPEFWSSLMMILIFSVWLGIFPSGGYVSPFQDPIESLRRLIMPAIVLGAQTAAYSSRMMRSSLLEVIMQDYITTARAKGLAERVVIYKHALKNALIPVVTVVGFQVGYLLGGAVIIEQIFLFPGIGRLTLDAVYKRDYILVQGCVLVICLIFVLSNLIVDILYSYLDPRIRYR